MKRNASRILLFLLVLGPLYGFVHPFYFSYTQVDFNPQTESLEVTLKLFTNDLEDAMEAQGTERLFLGDQREHKFADRYLETYLRNGLKFWVNGNEIEYKFLGKEVELDITWVYVELEKVGPVEKLKVKNVLLHELFEDQQNVIQVKMGDQRKSMLLRKGSAEDEIVFE